MKALVWVIRGTNHPYQTSSIFLLAFSIEIRHDGFVGDTRQFFNPNKEPAQMKTISISGEAFEVSAPYAAGHVITEAEAKALNQTRAENIGNNFRAQVKKALEDGTIANVRQAIADYDSRYEFSMTIARTPIDPVEAEAFKIAKEVVKAKIADKYGMALKKYFETEGNEEKFNAAVEKIAGQDDTLKLAKKRIADKKKSLDIVGEELAL